MSWSHWAQAADENKNPIAEAIAPYFSAASQILEIGSGTGQHAVHFATRHPQVHWQPSEHPNGLQALERNLQQQQINNIANAIELDAGAESWPQIEADLIYSANTTHIMSWRSVCQLFKHIALVLQPGQQALFYGPFRFADRPFASSNVAFDSFLKQHDPQSGIRDIDSLKAQAEPHQLLLSRDIEMPANNHILVWQRTHP